MINFPVPDVLDNLGGAIRFWFTPADDVATIAEAVNQLISTLTFDGGKDWYEGYSLPGSLIPVEQPTETESGTKYQCSLKGSYPKESASVTAMFEELKNLKHIVAYLEGNNQYKLMGSLDAPCRFRYSITNVEGTNQYDFEFYVDSPTPLYFISSNQII